MTQEAQPIYESDPNTVFVPEKRQRTVLDRGKLNELKNSIVEHGQLQPGLCSKEGEKLILLFGFRRLTACQELGIKFRYELTSDILDPVKKKEIELHENLIRSDLTFLEIAAARSELHKMYQVHKGGAVGTTRSSGRSKSWTLEDTAGVLGISTGALSEDIKLDRFAKAIPEVAKAKTKNEAKATVKRIETQTVRQIALEKAIAAAPTCEVVGGKDQASSPQDQIACLLQEYSKHVHNRSFEEILPQIAEPGQFSIVFFDPPWGVGLDQSYVNSGDKEMYNDNPKTYFKTLRRQLALLFTYMAPNSHLYLKFGIVNHFFTYQMLRKTGFEVNSIPILWHKVGAHRTRQPNKWPGQCYEPIAFARKGNKPLVQVGRPNIIPTRPPGKKMKQDHPDAMHPDLIREILLRSAMPGESVLDPMCGSGMFGVACESLRSQLQLRYLMIEEKKVFYELSLTNLVKGYEKITAAAEKDKEEDEEQSKDYRSVEIGSAAWMQIWTKHPELRDEMSEWQKKGGSQ